MGGILRSVSTERLTNDAGATADAAGAPADAPAGPADVLRANGLQVTAQRIAVLQSIASAPHSTADDVAAQVREQLGTISRQAVYDALKALVERGIVRRIEPAGLAARYEDRVGDNHHHLVCRTCGHIVDVDCATGETPCLIPIDDGEFIVDEAEVVYWGHCPDCQTQPVAAVT